LIGSMRGRRFTFDSDAMGKLIDSACYRSARFEADTGFVPRRHLQQALPEMVAYLERHV